MTLRRLSMSIARHRPAISAVTLVKDNWSRFKLPPIRSKHGWLLAGGIKPENVSEALPILRPDGVDVSSGICASDGIQKGISRISSFMTAVSTARDFDSRFQGFIFKGF